MNIAKVLAVLLQHPLASTYGYDIMQRTGLKSGQIYSALARLEKAGWIEGRTELVDPAAEGRPPRRYYLLTSDGTVLARQALAELHEALRFTHGGIAEGQVRPA